MHVISLQRPYGTSLRCLFADIPTLKRGANNQCAYGAFSHITDAVIHRRLTC